MVARLGEPPEPPSKRLRASDSLVRVYHEHPVRDGLEVRTFGPLNRFDPHVRDGNRQPREAPDGRGVLYLARDLGTGLAEAYSGHWPQVAICLHARAARVRPRDAIDVLDLTADGALAIGAVGTLAWGDEPRPLTQRWGRRIYAQYTHLNGITYRAAHQGGEAVVLWDRAPAVVRPTGGDRRLWAVWRYVQVALAAQGRQPRRIAAADCPTCRRYGYAG